MSPSSQAKLGAAVARKFAPELVGGALEPSAMVWAMCEGVVPVVPGSREKFAAQIVGVYPADEHREAALHYLGFMVSELREKFGWAWLLESRPNDYSLDQLTVEACRAECVSPGRGLRKHAKAWSSRLPFATEEFDRAFAAPRRPPSDLRHHFVGSAGDYLATVWTSWPALPSQQAMGLVDQAYHAEVDGMKATAEVMLRKSR